MKNEMTFPMWIPAIETKNKKLGEKGHVMPSIKMPIKTSAIRKENASENHVAS